LFSSVYRGNQPDQKSCLGILSEIRKRLSVIGREVEDLTLVMDKGNCSKAIQADLKRLKLHWVGSLAGAWYPGLLKIPTTEFHEVTLSNGETMPVHRLKHQVFGDEVTVVITINERLRAGQLQGMNDALVLAQKGLAALKDSLTTTRRPWRRDVVEREIGRLLAREHLKEVFRVEVKEVAGRLSLSYEFDEQRYEQLKTEVLGKKILFTDQDNWSESEIVEAYHGLGRIERIFRHLKNPYHLAVRPQFPWRDQKIKVHTFCCLMGQVLTGLVHRKVTKAGIKISSDRLLDELNRIREVTVMEKSEKPGRPRVRNQLEYMPEELHRLQEAAGVVYTSPSR
jgi:transposase